MNLAMVTAAQWYGEFIAHLAAERGALREAHMVGVRRFAAADQAGLLSNEPDVIAVANSPRLGEDKHALVDGFAAPLANRPEGIAGGAPGFRRCGFIDRSDRSRRRCWLTGICGERETRMLQPHRNGLVIVTLSTSRP